MKFDEVPFVPCNDCTAYESCTQEAYEQGKKDAEEECDRCIYSGMKPFLKRRKDAYLDGYDKGMAKANKVHEEMCKTCIHKVSKSDVEAIIARAKADAIDDLTRRLEVHCFHEPNECESDECPFWRKTEGATGFECQIFGIAEKIKEEQKNG